VILNTHQLHFALECDEIIVMQKGKIIVHGTYEEIEETHPEVFKLAF